MRKHRAVQIIGIVIIAAALVYLILGVIGAISLGGSGLGAGWSSGWRGWLTIPILTATFLGFVALLVFGALLYFLAKIDTNLAEAQQRFAAAAAKSAAASAAAAAAAASAAATAGPVVEVAAPAVAAPVVEAATVEVAAPAAAAVAAGVVAAERHEDAVEAGVAATEVEVAAPAVEVAAPVVAAAAVTIAADQHEETVAVEAAAPVAEMAAPAVEGAAPVVAAAAPAGDETEALRAQIAGLQAQLAAMDSSEAPATVTSETPGRLPGMDEAARIAAEMAALKPPKS